MKHLRKSILTLLALTLFGGAGAWAQQEVLLTTVTATTQTTSSQSPEGIVTVSLNDIVYCDGTYGWLYGGTVTVEAPQGYTITQCVFWSYDGTPLTDNMAPFTATIVNGGEGPSYVSTGQAVSYMDGIKSIEVYGYAPAQEIELTKVGANQWSLGQTPDYDLELQVEYYEAHALKNIPAGWTVLINGHDSTSHIVEGSLNITETDTVTLVPAGNPRRVKSVTLEEEAPAVQTVNIGGINLQIAEGDTWAQIIARNPGVLEAWGSMVASDEGVLELGGHEVLTSTPYNPAQRSDYYWGT